MPTAAMSGNPKSFNLYYLLIYLFLVIVIYLIINQFQIDSLVYLMRFIHETTLISYNFLLFQRVVPRE